MKNNLLFRLMALKTRRTLKNGINLNLFALTLLTLATIVVGSSSVAWAQNTNQKWTTVASAGTVDQKDVSLVTFNGPVASLTTAAPDQSTLHIRYNVVPVDGLFDPGCAGYRLRVRYRDEFSQYGLTLDPGIQVVVTLKSINLFTGAVSTLLTFNSNQFAAAYGFQTQLSDYGWFTFDFASNAYWIEAYLIRGQLNNLYFMKYPAPAALATIQIASDGCIN